MVTNIIYEESRKSGIPILFIVDDTISSKSIPSSKASHPIESLSNAPLLCSFIALKFNWSKFYGAVANFTHLRQPHDFAISVHIFILRLRINEVKAFQPMVSTTHSCFFSAL